MSRPTKLMNNPIKQRYHYGYDMNLDSTGVSKTIFHSQVDKVQQIEELSSTVLENFKKMAQPPKFKSIHKIDLEEENKTQFSTARNLLSYRESVDKVVQNFSGEQEVQSPEKDVQAINIQENEGLDQYNSLNPNQVKETNSSFVNRFKNSLRDARSQSLNNPPPFGTSNSINNTIAFDQKTKTLRNLEYPSTQREIKHKKEIYVDSYLPGKLTSYRTFFKNPYENQNEELSPVKQEQQPNKFKIVPGFYQSVLPKSLNQVFRAVTQKFEQDHYLYRTPICVIPRDYKPEPETRYRKKHLLTNTKWTRNMRSNKTYY